MDITFRRDPISFRPRTNKQGSTKDREQKKAGNYFLLHEGEATRSKVAAEENKQEEESKGVVRDICHGNQGSQAAAATQDDWVDDVERNQ